jgi:hypothetical protein
MITMYECTDCQHCLSFYSGVRLACGSGKCLTGQVYNFLPVGTGDAKDCEFFFEGNPRVFSKKDLDEAEALYKSKVNLVYEPELYTDCLMEIANVRKI